MFLCVVGCCCVLLFGVVIGYLAFLFFEPSDILPMPKPLGGGIVNRNSKFPLLPSVQEIGNLCKYLSLNPLSLYSPLRV